MPKNPHTVCVEIKDFVAETFLVDFGIEGGVEPDTDLFEAKYIDSFGFVELVVFLEQRYAVKLSEDDLADPRMATLAGIQALILSRLAPAAP